MAAQLAETARPIRELRPDVPASLADVLMRSLEKDPLRRPHSASVIVKTIDALHAVPTPPSAMPPSVAEAVPVSPDRSGWPTAFAAVAVLLLVAAAWWVGSNR
jgi:serine/threonine-protein kinase